jgi:hypothetical protein
VADQAGVDARAEVIVNGPPGADATGQTKGLRFPQWQFRFSWLSDRVPLLNGTPDHIRAGDFVAIDMEVFGVTKFLPVRTLRITFPTLDEDGDPLVLFTGTFGLQVSDPFTLWRFALQNESRVILQTTASVNESSTAATYGSNFRGTPSPATDGAEDTFSIPFGYITGTLEVYRNGLIQRPTIDFTESDNEAGEFTMSEPPLVTDSLIVECNTLAG